MTSHVRGHSPLPRHAGRGLCPPCHDRKAGEYDRLTRPGDEVLAEREHLRAAGYTDPQIAARLGMSWPTYYRACLRRGVKVTAVAA